MPSAKDPPQPEIPSAFVDLEERIATGFARGDAAAIAREYTADALLMLPERPALEGREAIEAHYRQLFEHATAEIHQTRLEARLAGHWGFLRGTYHLVARLRRGGRKIESRGKYLAILERQDDGSWKLSRDIVNADHPRPLSLLGFFQGLLGFFQGLLARLRRRA